MKNMAIWAFALCISTLAAASEAGDSLGLTAAQIAEKNAAARGGLEAWRKIQTVTWIGHIESANAPQPSLPFELEMKRPGKTRFEIKLPGQSSVRMYDGTRGWKLRQAGHGKPEAQPYTPDELSFARDGQGIDGPLMDYQAKGIAIALDGVDEVEGHRAYRLSIKLPSGASHHVWVDAQTFLELKYDRVSRSKFGQSALVTVFYRNYKTVEGLQIPFMIESRPDNATEPGQAKATNKMVIDRVFLNPPLEDKVFAYPGAAGRGREATPGIGHPQSARIPPPGILGPGIPGAPRRINQSSGLEQQ
jgi:hypothetical protein